jgi:hypothetical protein
MQDDGAYAWDGHDGAGGETNKAAHDVFSTRMVGSPTLASASVSLSEHHDGTV